MRNRMSLRLRLVMVALVLGSMSISMTGWSAQGSFERTLAVTGPVQLSVETGAGDITIRPGSASHVHVYGTIKATNGWVFSSGDAQEKVKQLENHPPITQEGNFIRIGNISDPALRHNVSISYQIETPAETQLTAASGSGDVTASGVHGPVKATSGSGDVRISDIGDELTASTGSGDVQANSIRGEVHLTSGSGDIRALEVGSPFYVRTGSGSVRLIESSSQGDASSSGGKVSTGSGSIQVSGVSGPLGVVTGSGDVTVQGSATGDWNLGTGSGTVVVHLPEHFSFNLDAHTDSGRILAPHLSITLQGSIGKGELRGRVGSGGPLVKLRTGSGDIQVE
jgi:hypothetical protein